MKHLKTFEGFSVVEEGLFDIFKSEGAKGFAVSTQGANFETYVQQALKGVKYMDMDISDLYKADFMKFAELIKAKNLDFKQIKASVKSDAKLEKILEYICARGSKSAGIKAGGEHAFGSAGGPASETGVSKEFDPIAAVEKCRDRVAKQAPIPPKAKLESLKTNRKFKRTN
jgi:hypothetical protein